MIRSSDRISAVLARDERLVDVLVSASPTFAKLRNLALRRTFAHLVTVEQAAKIAGVDAAQLVARLNAVLGDGHGAALEPLPAAEPAIAAAVPAPIPDHLRDLPPERWVDVDVREDLRAGREPFRQIMDAARSLGPEQVLRVRAIFEPAPLYAVLGKQGLAHATERLAADDWRVWFYRQRGAQPAAAGATPEPAAPAEANDDVIILDVRGLEPPEPMVKTLEALAQLPVGKTLVQINVRVPQFLLPKLAERGFTWQVHEQSAELVRLFIRHATP